MKQTRKQAQAEAADAIRQEFATALQGMRPALTAGMEQMAQFCHAWFSSVQNFDRDNFDGDCMLVNTELAEAVEADRKKLKDGDLPAYDGRDVEIADAMIRLFHMIGKYELNSVEALFDKMLVNLRRPIKHGKEY